MIHLQKHICVFIEQKDQEIDYFRKTKLILKVAYAKEKFKRETFEFLTKYGQKLNEYPLFPLLSLSEINYRFERLENIIKYNYTDIIQDIIMVSKAHAKKVKEKNDLKTIQKTNCKLEKEEILKEKPKEKPKEKSETSQFLSNSKKIHRIREKRRNEKLMERGRKTWPANATLVLKNWLTDHFNNPYPNYDEKVKLVEETGLTINQVHNWFTNARSRNMKKGKKDDKFCEIVKKMYMTMETKAKVPIENFQII